MKKRVKTKIKEVLNVLGDMQKNAELLIKNADLQGALQSLEECQNLAISLGTKIEELEGEGTSTVSSLEHFCEQIYSLYEGVVNLGSDASESEISELEDSLSQAYIDVMDRFEQDIPQIREVVFLPYKASMWDSLESVWKRAEADPLVDAIVIPIPYYDKNPDGSFREVHYEGDEFPEYVKITHYDQYDLKTNHPEEIYIHNPYDEFNNVTSVHPAFYSKTIKDYTDKLIYIPYFVLNEINTDDEKAIEAWSHYAQLPGVLYADEVIVQSENMKKFYVESMVLLLGEKVRKEYEAKIKGTGSPKVEKLLEMKAAGASIPKEWEKHILREDGTRKKIVLYNTSVSALLKESEKMLEKMEQVFGVFKENSNDIALLWRPHPLIEATIKSMRTGLWDEYQAMVQRYKEEEIGIYDDSPELDRALVLADAYYGDQSSLVALCKEIKIPIMIQNVDIR